MACYVHLKNGFTAEINTAYTVSFLENVVYIESFPGCFVLETGKIDKITTDTETRVWVSFRDELGIVNDMILPGTAIEFGNVLEYGVESARVEVPFSELLEIWFE